MSQRLSYKSLTMCRNRPLHVVTLGTYDKGKPRIRILLRGLRESGVRVTECHFDVWGGIEDKSQIRGIGQKLSIVCRLILAYPVLIWRYLQLPKHDAVLVGYLGLFDVLMLWPMIRMRRAVFVWDVFLSLYNTVVEDRALVGKHNPLAFGVWAMEWLALRLVDIALMDTQAHADYLARTYRCDANKVQRIFVGVEPEVFDLSAKKIPLADPDTSPKIVLFYGQFIPLHGIETVVRAAKLTEDEGIKWLLIGKGQEAPMIRELVEQLRPKNLEWIEWVEYEELVAYLARCHVALGIFGTTSKAARVIPNKVYQILAAGRPLITADSAAIRELLVEGECVGLVRPGSPECLANAVQLLLQKYPGDCLDSSLVERFTPQTLGAEIIRLITANLGT